jgi:hypothetical protein
MHIHIQSSIYTYKHTYSHVCMLALMRICIITYIFATRCMQVFTHAYMQTNMYESIYPCIKAYTYTCIHMHMQYTYLHAIMQKISKQSYQHACLLIYMHACIYIYTCIHTCMHVNIPAIIHMHMHTCILIYMYVLTHSCMQTHTCLCILTYISYKLSSILNILIN